MFKQFRKELMWGGRKLVLETGKIARQADGAVMVTYGETVVLATVVGVKTPKKWEYSLKLGTSDKDAQTYELMNNILEGKIKKSFELKKGSYT